MVNPIKDVAKTSFTWAMAAASASGDGPGEVMVFSRKAKS
jgi:hypothetical protein